MAGLLDYASSIAGEAKNYASSVADEAKKNVQGLLADPKQALMDILNNLTARAAASQAKTKAAWATRDPKIMAQNALDSSQTALGFAPLGITAWHGSPHKFNKFSMDKIGTGEGAQAYGHGLYLAESPSVAKSYADTLSQYHIDTRDGMKSGGDFADALVANAGDYPASLSSAIRSQANKVATDLAGGKTAEQVIASMRNGPYARMYAGLADAVEKMSPTKAGGSLYKVDLPDNAIARMLDWDKPLSQQAPEVQKALLRIKSDAPNIDDLRRSYDDAYNAWQARSENISADELAKLEKSVQDSYQLLQDGSGFGNRSGASIYTLLAKDKPYSAGAETLQNYGIPGIRYLDGGSRSAGQGSSNFVVFDPEMIRILERNGQATGAAPWQPGEWRGLLGNN